MNFHSVEAEQSLLGALILNNGPIMDMELKGEDFLVPEHAEIYTVMQQLFTEKQRFDLTDFDAWGAGKTSPLKDTGLPKYVRALTDSIISTVSLPDWGATIRELSRKRFIGRAIGDAQAALVESSSAEVIARLQSDLTEKLDAKRQKTAEALFAEIESELDTPPVCYPTRLKHLDKGMAGGLYKGFTYGICGKEKAGKTTFAHSISYNLGHAGCKHLYVALEMGAKQIEQRNIARSLGINSLEFITPSDDLKTRIKTAKKTSDIIYLDAPGSTLDEILHEIGMARIKHGITGFIIDYWQLVGGSNPKETEERHLRTTAQSFADYARKHGLWCVLLAQMNKEGDLFGGGGLRKACDQLYFIETPERLPDARWLRMGASRYTPQFDVGNEDNPKFVLNKKIGPHFQDIYGA